MSLLDRLLRKPKRDIVEEGLRDAVILTMKDDDIDGLLIETEFWVAVKHCEFCRKDQLCSIHYDRYVYTL